MLKKIIILLFFAIIFGYFGASDINAQQCPTGQECRGSVGSCIEPYIQNQVCGRYYGTRVRTGFCYLNGQNTGNPCTVSESCCAPAPWNPGGSCNCAGYTCTESNACQISQNLQYQACDPYSQCNGGGGSGCFYCTTAVVYRCRPQNNPPINCAQFPNYTYCQPGDTACTTILANCQAACVTGTPVPPTSTGTPYPTPTRPPTNTPGPTSPPQNYCPAGSSCAPSNECYEGGGTCVSYSCGGGQQSCCCEWPGSTPTLPPGTPSPTQPPQGCQATLLPCSTFRAVAHGVVVRGSTTNPPTLEVQPNETIEFYSTGFTDCGYIIRGAFNWGDGRACIERAQEFDERSCDPDIEYFKPIYYCDGGYAKVYSHAIGGSDGFNAYNSPGAQVVAPPQNYCRIGDPDTCEGWEFLQPNCNLTVDGYSARPYQQAEGVARRSYATPSTYLVQNWSWSITNENNSNNTCKINIRVTTVTPTPGIVIQGRVNDYALNAPQCVDNGVYVNGETVQLKTSPNGPPVQTVTTMPYQGFPGAFRFFNVTPGSYYVCPVRGYCRDYFHGIYNGGCGNWSSSTNCLYVPNVTATVGGLRLIQSTVCMEPQLSCRYDMYQSNTNSIPVQGTWASNQVLSQHTQIRDSNTGWWFNNWFPRQGVLTFRDTLFPLTPTPPAVPAVPNGTTVRAKACYRDCANPYRDHFSNYSPWITCLTGTPIPLTPTATPTPPVNTPTPQPWKKVVNGSFQTRVSSFVNDIPASVTAFDADDPGRLFFIDNSVTGTAFGALSVRQTTLPANRISVPQWRTSSYTITPQFDPTRYFNYIRSRKDYREIYDVNGITADGIYYYRGDDISQMPQPTVDYVLIVEPGRYVNIAANSFNVGAGDAPNRSIAIIAEDLRIASNVTRAYGLFLANNVTVGANTTGIKIKGNLVATNNLNFGRSNGNNTAPSLLIVHYPTTYLNLLPYLSTSVYDWQELVVDLTLTGAPTRPASTITPTPTAGALPTNTPTPTSSVPTPTPTSGALPTNTPTPPPSCRPLGAICSKNEDCCSATCDTSFVPPECVPGPD